MNNYRIRNKWIDKRWSRLGMLIGRFSKVLGKMRITMPIPIEVIKGRSLILLICLIINRDIIILMITGRMWRCRPFTWERLTRKKLLSAISMWVRFTDPFQKTTSSSNNLSQESVSRESKINCYRTKLLPCVVDNNLWGLVVRAIIPFRLKIKGSEKNLID